MTVSLLEILAAARAHAAPLAAESAGYLLLAVADHAAAVPRAVSADEVELTGDGSVRLRPRRVAGETSGVERHLRRLLGRTLEVSSSVGPSLRRVAERHDDAGLDGLVRELEKALIPVNRSAARRALSRLHRETERARDAGQLERWLAAEQVTAQGPAPSSAAPLEPAARASASAERETSPNVARDHAPDVDLSQLVTELPEPSPVALPRVEAAVVAPAPARSAAPVAPPELTLTPEPRSAVSDAVLTKPEPVVVRSRERGGSTPRFGTVVTAQTLPSDESERTERAPDVALDEADPEPGAELAIDIDIELEDSELAASATGSDAAQTPTPVRALAAALAPQPLLDPEPSVMPDVLLAMASLHAGVDADDAPTRLRDVVTAALPAPVNMAHVGAEAEAAGGAESASAEADSWAPAEAWAEAQAELTQAALRELEVEAELEITSSADAKADPNLELASEAELAAPEERVTVTVEPYVLFQSELAEPELHEALTWDPGPVELRHAPLPPTLQIAEPEPELSPLAPAVLPVRQSDVSELLDSFYVSDGAEEPELRSALKEMAGLSLTPLPHRLVSEG